MIECMAGVHRVGTSTRRSVTLASHASSRVAERCRPLYTFSRPSTVGRGADTQAYLEFFVSPELLSPLIRRIERDPRITYYAVNRQGDLRTNTHSEGPNAVTWGVFPGKEIVQPTIVEAVSFIAWK